MRIILLFRDSHLHLEYYLYLKGLWTKQHMFIDDRNVNKTKDMSLSQFLEMEQHPEYDQVLASK